MHIHDFTQAKEILATYSPPAGSMKREYKLDRMRRLMTAIGNPQNKLKIIHVAGTSGKTSTCYYAAALLKAVNQKVGLTVSPHVDEINERVQINLEPLPEKEFCHELGIFLDLVSATTIQPTYFELFIAFAFWEFHKQQVDYAVIEVGLGGLLDGTNVIERADKVCIITDIGLDHVDVLGSKLEGIAAQKAGIIQDHNSVFSYRHSDQIMTVIEEVAHDKQADLHEITMPELSSLPLELPLFQRRNWYLAQVAVNFMLARDKLQLPTIEQQQDATKIAIPARMEVIQYKGKTVVLDGAHNQQKMNVLVTSFVDLFPNTQATVLLSLVDGKDLDTSAVLVELKPVTKQLFITSFSGQQDLPKYSIKAETISHQAKSLGIAQVTTIPNPEEAFQTALESANSVLLVCGSFYLLNHIRPLIFKRR